MFAPIENINVFKPVQIMPDLVSLQSHDTRKIRVLLVDDDVEIRNVVRECLITSYRCKVDFSDDTFEAMSMLVENYYDLVIMDWRLSALAGGQALIELEKGFYYEPEIPMQWGKERVPVVIFSGTDKEKYVLCKTKHFECIGFVSKRQSIDDIVDSFATYFQIANEKRHGAV